jgi:Domain of unknown function (DUF4760)
MIAVVYNQKIARRRATLDVIMAHQFYPHIIADRRKFIALREQGHLAQWAAPEKASSDEAALIKTVLNHHELVAIGIRRKTLHKKIYKEWLRTGVVKDWIESKPFVAQLRHNTKNKKVFCEFESLAKKWANKSERDQV